MRAGELARRVREALTGEATPISRAPVIEHGGIGKRIGIGVINAALRLFDVIATGIEGPPARFARLAVLRSAPLAGMPTLSHAEIVKIMLRGFERHSIRAAGHAWESQLRKIVFPVTNRTGGAAPGLTFEHPVTATWAGEFVEVHTELIRRFRGNFNWTLSREQKVASCSRTYLRYARP